MERLPKRVDASIVRWMTVAVVFSTIACALAHEGHKALPTRGAEVDLQHGLITLSPDAFRSLAVKTAEVDVQPVNETVLAYATLVAPWQQHAFVTSRVGGRIAKLHVHPGDRVTKGQTIAEVESAELENLLLDFVNARNDLKLSTKIVEHFKALSGQLVAGKEISEAAAKNQENQDAVTIVRGKLLSLGLTAAQLDEQQTDAARASIRLLPVRSPIAGRVIHADLSVGKVVEPSEHLFEIVDASTVWVKIGVLEQDLFRIQAGQQIQLVLNAFPNEVVSTQVDMHVPFLDPESHLGTVWAQLANDPQQPLRFLPGMSGQATIVVSKPDKSVRVPRAALVADGAERYVLVEESADEKSHEYRRENVIVGVQNSSHVQIRGGKVFPGDRVVTAGSRELSNFFVQGILRLSPEAKRNIGLSLTEVRSQVVEDVITLDGLVEIPPEGRGLVSSPLAGVLESIRVDRGQVVHQGDVMGEIASLESQNLQLELLRNHLLLGVREDTLKRAQTLSKESLASARKLWEAEADVSTARNRQDSLRRRLEQLGFTRQQIDEIIKGQQAIATLPLRAPIDGAVVHFDKALGQALKAEEPLFEVHNLAHPRIVAYVTERELADVRVGLPARVRLTSDPNFLAEGKVVRSGGTFGMDQRTLQLWIDLTAPTARPLQHNMLARITLVRAQAAPVLAVPPTSLVQDGQRSFVFVEKSDGTFDRRSVVTGRADDRFVEIRQGLSAGEKVASQGSAGLQTAYASLR